MSKLTQKKSSTKTKSTVTVERKTLPAEGVLSFEFDGAVRSYHLETKKPKQFPALEKRLLVVMPAALAYLAEKPRPFSTLPPRPGVSYEHMWVDRFVAAIIRRAKAVDLMPKFAVMAVDVDREVKSANEAFDRAVARGASITSEKTAEGENLWATEGPIGELYRETALAFWLAADAIREKNPHLDWRRMFAERLRALEAAYAAAIPVADGIGGTAVV